MQPRWTVASHGRWIPVAGILLLASLLPVATPAGASARTTVPAPVVSTAHATLPEVVCRASGPGPRRQVRARRATVTADPATVRGWSAYVTTGARVVLAPSGWHCAGVVYQDGGEVFVLSPPGRPTPRLGSGAGDVLAHVARGIVVQHEDGCVGCAWGLVHTLFPSSTAICPLPADRCTVSPPAGETQQALTADAIAFHDPPSVHGSGTPSGGALPATGAALSAGYAAATITCVLPARTRHVCQVTVGAFAAAAPAWLT